MAEAILPGSSAGGSGGSGMWEHIGTFYNTSSALRINGPSMSTIEKYTIIAYKITILKTITPTTENLALYFYGSGGGLIIYKGIPLQPKTFYNGTMYRICQLDNSGDGVGYYWMTDHGTYEWRELDSNYPVEVKILTPHSYPIFSSSSNTISIDMYGIKDPFSA